MGWGECVCGGLVVFWWVNTCMCNECRLGRVWRMRLVHVHILACVLGEYACRLWICIQGCSKHFLNGLTKGCG